MGGWGVRCEIRSHRSLEDIRICTAPAATFGLRLNAGGRCPPLSESMEGAKYYVDQLQRAKYKLERQNIPRE